MKTLKMRTKPLHKLEHQGVIRSTLNSWEHSLLISNGSIRQLKVKTLYSSIIHPFGYLKWHGFHGNPSCDYKDWECSFKILISQQHLILELRERSGSVVECLTRDRRAAGSSLTGVTALCP